MNICGVNFFVGEKGDRVDQQLSLLEKIFLSNKENRFERLKSVVSNIELSKLDFFVTCGDIKITFNKKLIEEFLKIKSVNKPILIRDVTYLREIPKIKNLDVNNFPRFTWNSILPDQQNFPFDPSYDRWSDIKKKYNLEIRDYQKQGDKILFFLQIQTDASLNELNFDGDGYLNFMIKTIKKILKYTDRKIILRSHPLNKNKDRILDYLINYFSETKKIISSNNYELEDDLKNVKCVVSFNSSATVEALFKGINVINLSKKQPCFSAAHNDLSKIEDLNELNRNEFLKKISFLHWENNEFKSKEFRKYFCNLLEKSAQNLNKLS